MKRPGKTLGLRHVALWVKDMSVSRHFYVDLMGMEEEWQPDEENLYLTSGNDNLALHKGTDRQVENSQLDHIGFFLATPESVDEWHVFLKQAGVKVHCEPRTHRDGARSFYCDDPDGTTVQIIFHPPIVAA